MPPGGGVVVMSALIGTDGRVKTVKATSGNPLLALSAMDAVRQWRYKPYVENGAPSEFETQIKISFQMR
jgi:periplasmic protein TonB